MDYQQQLAYAFQLFEEKKVDEAKKIYDDVLENVSSEEAEIFARMNYGYILAELKQFDQAISNYERIREIGEKNENQELVAQSYHQIGMVYRLFKKYEEALDYFEKEKQVIKEAFQEDFLFLSANAYELGMIHLLLGKFKVAKNYLYQSLTYAEQSDDPITSACAYRGLGEYYQQKSDIETAKEMYEKSIEIFEKAEDTIGVAEVEKLLENLST